MVKEKNDSYVDIKKEKRCDDGKEKYQNGS